MAEHRVVSHDEWVKARKKHLAKEKEFTRLRDQLSRERRELQRTVQRTNLSAAVLADALERRQRVERGQPERDAAGEGPVARGHAERIVREVAGCSEEEPAPG